MTEQEKQQSITMMAYGHLSFWLGDNHGSGKGSEFFWRNDEFISFVRPINDMEIIRTWIEFGVIHKVVKGKTHNATQKEKWKFYFRQLRNGSYSNSPLYRCLSQFIYGKQI